jgi:rubrerythrin
MVDELAVTNVIWRYWNEHKIKPPFEWHQLRMRVEEASKEGKTADQIIQAFTKEGLQIATEEVPLLYTKTITDRINAAIAEEKEAIDDYAELENQLREAGLSAQADIVNEIRFDEMDHKVKFEVMLKGEYPPMEIKPTTFHLESAAEVSRVRDILRKHNISFREVHMGLEVHVDPDYALEVLAEEGYDTSRIMVER